MCPSEPKPSHCSGSLSDESACILKLGTAFQALQKHFAVGVSSNFTQAHAQLNMTKLNDHTHIYSLEMPFILMLLEGNTKIPKIFHVKPKRVSIDAHQAHQVKTFDQAHQGHQAHQAGS